MDVEEKLKIAMDALKQCANPAGAYDMDRLRHAENTIRDTANIAKEALTILGEDFTNVEIRQ